MPETLSLHAHRLAVLVASLGVLLASPAEAQLCPAAGPDQALCRQECEEVPGAPRTSPASPRCLAVVRFGAAAVAAIEGRAVDGGALDPMSPLAQHLELARLRFRTFGTEKLPTATRAELDRLHAANLALFPLVAAGRLDEALAETDRILATRQALLGAGHPLVAEALSNRGFLRDMVGRTAEAETDLRDALERRRGALGPDDVLVGNTLNNLCTVLSHLGRLEDAVAAGRRALVITESVMGTHHPSTASVRNNLAVALTQAGALDESRALLTRVVDALALTRGPGDPWTLTAHGNLASLLVALGDLAGAEALEREVLSRAEALGDAHPVGVVAATNLGVTLLARGATAEAVTALREALRRVRVAHGEGHPAEPSTLQSLAAALAATGDRASARAAYDDALAQATRAHGEAHPVVATILNNRGALDRDVPTLERALAHREALLGGWHPDVSSTLGNLVVAKWGAGDVSGARALQPRVLAILRDHFQANLSGADSDLGVLRFLSSVRAPYEVSLSLFDGPQDAPVIFGEVLVWQGAGTLAETLWHDERRATRKDPARRALERERLRLIMTPGKAAEAEALGRRLGAGRLVGLTVPSVCEALARADATLWNVVRFDRFTPGAASEGRYDAFRVAPKGCSVTRVSLGSAAQVDAEVSEWRRATDAAARCEDAGCPGAYKALEAASKAIYSRLHAALGEPPPRLWYVPDGRLVEVPLAALTDGARYVVERSAVSTLPYPAAATRVSPPPASGPPLVVGDLQYDEAADLSGHWSRCDGAGCGSELQLAANTASEAHRRAGGICGPGRTWQSLVPTEASSVALALGREFPGTRLAVGGAADERRVLAALSGSRAIHLATHGYFSPPACEGGDPLRRSALVLSGANRGGDLGADGLLTARDLAGAELEGTALVVLSACETGRGDAVAGEGALGLARSFGVAGAGAVVASLWEVPNDETTALFDGFYTAWLEGRPLAEALQQAQLALLDSLRTDRPETRGSAALWGAFVTLSFAPGSPARPPGGPRVAPQVSPFPGEAHHGR